MCNIHIYIYIHIYVYHIYHARGVQDNRAGRPRMLLFSEAPPECIRNASPFALGGAWSLARQRLVRSA